MGVLGCGPEAVLTPRRVVAILPFVLVHCPGISCKSAGAFFASATGMVVLSGYSDRERGE